MCGCHTTIIPQSDNTLETLVMQYFLVPKKCRRDEKIYAARHIFFDLETTCISLNLIISLFYLIEVNIILFFLKNRKNILVHEICISVI